MGDVSSPPIVVSPSSFDADMWCKVVCGDSPVLCKSLYASICLISRICIGLDYLPKDALEFVTVIFALRRAGSYTSDFFFKLSLAFLMNTGERLCPGD